MWAISALPAQGSAEVGGSVDGHEEQPSTVRQPHRPRCWARGAVAPPHPSTSQPRSCRPAGPAKAPQPHIPAQSISAGNEAQARAWPAGRGRIPRQPRSPVEPPPCAAHFAAHGRKRCPPSVAWTRRRRATAAPNRPARSASLAAQRGEPAAPAVLASSGAAWGVCCLPPGPPKSRASRSVPTFPCAARTHISVEHKSTHRSPQRRPGGTAPAASRCT